MVIIHHPMDKVFCPPAPPSPWHGSPRYTKKVTGHQHGRAGHKRDNHNWELTSRLLWMEMAWTVPAHPIGKIHTPQSCRHQRGLSESALPGQCPVYSQHHQLKTPSPSKAMPSFAVPGPLKPVVVLNLHYLIAPPEDEFTVRFFLLQEQADLIFLEFYIQVVDACGPFA